MSSPSDSHQETFTSRLSDTFWLLLNTPMIPPEDKVDSKAVPMTDFTIVSGPHIRDSSRSSTDTYATNVSDHSAATS